MKNYLVFMVAMLLAFSCADAQQKVVKDTKGYFIPKTVKTIGLPWAAADTNFTTQYIEIPPGVKSVVCYLEVDTAGTTDTLNVAVYGSSTATTTKGSLITSFTTTATATYERKEIAIPDKYIYFVGTYTSGSTYPKHKYGRIIVSPRQ